MRSLTYQRFCAGILAAALALLAAVVGAAPPDGQLPPGMVGSKPTDTSSPVVALGGGLYKVGSVLVDRKASLLSIPGRVNQREGPIEYLAVAPDGKTYESVLTLQAQPLHIQLGLLLLGANFGGNLAFQGDTALPKGDSVDVSVSWIGDKGDSVHLPATDLMYEWDSHVVMPPTSWIFTGSMVRDTNLFAADMEGSIIAVYSDPVAILNNPAQGRINQTVYRPNADLLPPVGTNLTMKIKVPRR